MILRKRTFDSSDAPKSIVGLFSVASCFYEAFFEFITLFSLLYVQLASPISRGGPEQYRLKLLVITFGLVIVKILVGLGYTFMGYVIDKRDYPLGRYRTFILAGSTLTTFFFCILFFVTPIFDGWLYVFMFLLFYFLTYLCYSINDVAFFSYMNTFTSDEKKKSTYSSIINSIGVFGAYATASLSPSITAGDAKRNLTLFAFVLVVFYYVFQLLLGIFMKERKSSPVLLEKESRETVFSPLRLCFRDRQVLLTMFVFLLLFTAQDLVIGNSANYFYYEFGYGVFSVPGLDGGLSGGRISFFFTLFFGIGNALSGFCYPLFAKKMNKKQILIVFGSLICVVYFLLFFFGFRRGNEFFLCFLSFALSFVHGVIYTPLFVNCFELREYYQAKTGLDKNGSIQGLRGSLPSIANAAQVLFFYFFLSSSGLMDVNETIASFEACNASGSCFGSISDMNEGFIRNIDVYSKNIYLSSMTFLPLVLTLLSIILTVLFVKVNDERFYCQCLMKIKEQEKAK